MEGVPPIGVGSCSSITSFNLAHQFEDQMNKKTNDVAMLAVEQANPLEYIEITGTCLDNFSH
jgi:hypothetical protein